MNFILCVTVVAHLCLLQVKCRSLHTDSDAHSGLEIADEVNHDLENGGRLSWKKLKPILRREVQRIKNVIGMEANKLNQESTEPTFLIHSKEGDNLSSENVDTNEEISLKIESQMTTASSVESESAKENQREEPISESVLSGEYSTIITHDETLKLDPPLTTYDFPDNVISDILNQSGGSIVFQALNDNSSKSFEFDETTLLSEGGQIATLQEVSTIGSELLIDSETNQNLILAELISSQSNLIGGDDDSTDFTHEDYSTIVTSTFNKESELQDATGEETASDPDIAELNTDEIENENTEKDLAESLPNGKVTGISNTAPTVPKCPDPGWCVFWFLAQEDTCAKDSHCHGSLICCMWGCSKACVDADS